MHEHDNSRSCDCVHSEYVGVHGYSPSQREIGKGCYLTVSAVNHRLRMLSARRELTYIPNQARSVRLVKDDDQPPAA